MKRSRAEFSMETSVVSPNLWGFFHWLHSWSHVKMSFNTLSKQNSKSWTLWWSSSSFPVAHPQWRDWDIWRLSGLAKVTLWWAVAEWDNPMRFFVFYLKVALLQWLCLRVGQRVATLQLCFLVGQLKHSFLCVELLSQQWGRKRTQIRELAFPLECRSSFGREIYVEERGKCCFSCQFGTFFNVSWKVIKAKMDVTVEINYEIKISSP